MNARVRRLASSEGVVAVAVATAFKSSAIPLTRAAAFLSNPANYLVVAEVGHELAGFIAAYRLDRLDRDAKQLFIYEVGVAEAFRRQGIGTQLMGYVRTLVHDEGLMEAFVVTDHANAAAVRLYESTGGHIESDASMLFVYPGRAA